MTFVFEVLRAAPVWYPAKEGHHLERIDARLKRTYAGM
jgi:hypothetical protein